MICSENYINKLAKSIRFLGLDIIFCAIFRSQYFKSLEKKLTLNWNFILLGNFKKCLVFFVVFIEKSVNKIQILIKI